MLESQKNPGGSQFVSPRTDDTLRFFLSAFQFTSDPDTPVSMGDLYPITESQSLDSSVACMHINRAVYCKDANKLRPLSNKIIDMNFSISCIRVNLFISSRSSFTVNCM